MNFIFSLFSRNKRLTSLLILSLIVLAVPLTVGLSKKQQEVRQRAYVQHGPLYFAEGTNCNSPLTNSVLIAPNGEKTYTLCLDAPNKTILGFNLALSLEGQGLTIKSATAGKAALDLGAGTPKTEGNTIFFSTINPDRTITGASLNLFSFTLSANQSEGAGKLTVSSATITNETSGQNEDLSATPLSYTINASAPAPAQPAPPAPAAAPAVTKTCPFLNTGSGKCQIVTIGEADYKVEFKTLNLNGQVEAIITPPTGSGSPIEYGSNWSGFTPNQVLSNACSLNNKVNQAVAIAAGATDTCTAPAQPAAPPATAPAASTIRLQKINLGTPTYYCLSNEITLQWTLSPADAQAATPYTIYKTTQDIDNGTLKTLTTTDKTSFIDGGIKGNVLPDKPAGFYKYQVSDRNGVFSDLMPGTETASCRTQSVVGGGGGGSTTSTTNNIFLCEPFTGGPQAGNYACARIVNGQEQCAEDLNKPKGGTWTESSRSFTSCDDKSSNSTKSACCKQVSPAAAPTPTPTPTPGPQDIVLNLTLTVSGIGTPSGQNNNPIRKNNRPVAIAAKDAGGKVVEGKGSVNYNPALGKYTGSVNMGTTLAPDKTYSLVIKMGNFIKGFPPDIKGVSQALPPTTLKDGVDDDNNFDISYWGADPGGLLKCFGSSRAKPKTGCTDADLNDDGNVDGLDYNLFLLSLPRGTPASSPTPTPTRSPTPMPSPSPSS